jgi:ribonuclease Z
MDMFLKMKFCKPAPSVSYAFCSDTRYLESVIPIIKNVTVLYHESTFLHDLKEMADYTGHTTALEAATLPEKHRSEN